MSLIGPRTKSWRGWRVHVETSRMAGESDASVLRDDLFWPRSNNEKHPCSARFFDFFNRYSFIQIRLLPFVNMKCILCILSLTLSSLMLFCSLSPFSHYYTVRLTLRGLRACGDVRTSKTLHARPRVTTMRRRCPWADEACWLYCACVYLTPLFTSSWLPRFTLHRFLCEWRLSQRKKRVVT